MVRADILVVEMKAEVMMNGPRLKYSGLEKQRRVEDGLYMV